MNCKRIFKLLFLVAIVFAFSFIRVEAGVPGEDRAKELIYGKWAVYGTDGVKYEFSAENITIKQVDSFEPYGKSIVRVNMRSNEGEWNPRTTLIITYDSNNDKYELRIYKTNPRGDRTETSDKDYGKRFIKVYWD